MYSFRTSVVTLVSGLLVIGRCCASRTVVEGLSRLPRAQGRGTQGMMPRPFSLCCPSCFLLGFSDEDGQGGEEEGGEGGQGRQQSGKDSVGKRKAPGGADKGKASPKVRRDRNDGNKKTCFCLPEFTRSGVLATAAKLKNTNITSSLQ